MRDNSTESTTPGGRPLQGLGDPTSGSDRVKAPVAAAGSIGSGESQITQTPMKKMLEELSTSHEKQQFQLPWQQGSVKDDGSLKLLGDLKGTLEKLGNYIKGRTNVHGDIKKYTEVALSQVGKLERRLVQQKESLPKKRTRSVAVEVDLPLSPSFPSPARNTGDAGKRKQISPLSQTTNGEQNKKRKTVGGEHQQQPKAVDTENTQGGDFTKVVSKTKRRKDRRAKEMAARGQAEAVLVKAGESKEGQKPSYLEILKRVKDSTDSAKLIANVQRFEMTKDGDLIIKLQKGSKAGPMAEAVKQALGNEVMARQLSSKTLLEIRDIDASTTEDEVKKALIGGLEGAAPEEVKIRALRPAYRGTQLALAIVPEAAARSLLMAGKLRVEYVFARVRKRVEIPKCYKCLGFGHVAAKCKEADRSENKLCFNCGEAGHFVKDCKKESKCLACEVLKLESSHKSGDRKCIALRRAKEEAARRRKNG